MLMGSSKASTVTMPPFSKKVVRCLQRLGHVGGRHVVEVVQHQHLAVDGRDAGERTDRVEPIVEIDLGRSRVVGGGEILLSGYPCIAFGARLSAARP